MDMPRIVPNAPFWVVCGSWFGGDGLSFIGLAPSRVTADCDGYGLTMTILVILVILALLFGVGAVLEGLAWAILISLVLLAAAAWWGWTKVRGAAGRR